MDTNNKLFHLFQRYLDNTCSPGEVQVLLEYFGTHEDGDELRKLVSRELYADDEMPDEQKWQPVLDSSFENIKAAIGAAGDKPGALFFFKRNWFRVAAAIAIFFSAGGLYYFLAKSNQPAIASNGQTKSIKADAILPAGEKAVLTLANGSTVVLDGAANGELATQGKTKIIKLNNGQLSYQETGKSDTAVLYNTIRTPRGGQYRLILPDGSQVWLNAGSSLRYPTAFEGKERKVELTGEAYFEIFHNAAAPFKVAANNMEVEVLGTHFNVNVYGDESTARTTLLEGSVKINAGRSTHYLKPGQQAKLIADGSVGITDGIDTDEVMAWKNGLFIFNNLDVQSIMRQLSRWYDVDINYQGKISIETFSGIVSRQSNITRVLKIMEAGGIKFNIEGKKITVVQ